MGANVVFRKSYFAFQLAAAHKCDILVIVYLPEIRPKGKHTGFWIALLVAAPKLNKDHTETCNLLLYASNNFLWSINPLNIFVKRHSSGIVQEVLQTFYVTILVMIMIYEQLHREMQK